MYNMCTQIYLFALLLERVSRLDSNIECPQLNNMGLLILVLKFFDLVDVCCLLFVVVCYFKKKKIIIILITIVKIEGKKKW